ncbi:MAG: hypothetical protein AAF828_10440, partial [Bacteroidota bacterium]
LPLGLLLGGLALHLYSSAWLMDAYHLTGWENFKAIAYSNTFLMRCGQTLVLISVFMFGIARWPSMPKLITTIGSETLTIYCGHYVVLYGSLFGVGIAQYMKHALSPIPALVGAGLLIWFFIASMKYLPAIRLFVDSYWQPFRASILASYPIRRLRKMATV